MPPQILFDLSQVDFSRPVYSIEAIRRINPQRNQMEQLTAIAYEDVKTHTIVGYKDLDENEFWVPGHMPGFPIMPGVVMCECAAQLASFYAQKHKLLGGDFAGFGGMDDVKFRGPVFPPARFIIIVKMFELRPGRRAQFEFQGIVDGKLVFSGKMTGVPIERKVPPAND